MRQEPSHLAAIILAAGKGTRMKSRLPKVLHPVAGLPMVGRVIRTIRSIGIHPICCVIGGELDEITQALKPYEPLTFAVQSERLGTGQAVACAAYGMDDTPVPSYAKGYWWSGQKLQPEELLICAGDTPALAPEILRLFLDACEEKKSQLAVLAMDHPEPRGYGRIIMDSKGQLETIVEDKDANDEQKRIRICNSGIIFAKKTLLFQLLEEIKPQNSQNEYYLTDCFGLARKKGIGVDIWTTERYESFDGVNDRRQLAQLEARVQKRLKEQWMLKGVTFQQAETCYLEETVQLGEDVTIGPHTSLTGFTRVGDGARIGSHSSLHDAIIPAKSAIASGTICTSESTLPK